MKYEDIENTSMIQEDMKTQLWNFNVENEFFAGINNEF